MNIVIDTNVLMAGLLKNSIIRKILSSENIQFFIPEGALNEIEKYKEFLIKKSGIAGEEFKEVLDLLLENIEIIPEQKIKNKLKDAKNVMKDIDIKDSIFIATALSIESDGIWSFDNHFKKQNKIKVYDTKVLIKLI